MIRVILPFFLTVFLASAQIREVRYGNVIMTLRPGGEINSIQLPNGLKACVQLGRGKWQTAAEFIGSLPPDSGKPALYTALPKPIRPGVYEAKAKDSLYFYAPKDDSMVTVRWDFLSDSRLRMRRFSCPRGPGCEGCCCIGDPNCKPPTLNIAPCRLR